MVEYAPSNEPEANKRRSTRVVQAIPVTVTGVDALGQPFRERTSTLIINCNGFKLQSKHYVLKGTWLELEIPNPEAGQPPRKARACVTFVQRPRTVKELFQVGAELENPGNVWGVAFPPEDWIHTAETEEGAPSPAPPSAPPTVDAPAAGGPAIVPPLRPAATPPVSGPAAGLRVPPSVAADLTAGVPEQFSRMLSEAQEQIQKMAREATTAEIAREAASLLAELNGQMRAAAETAVEQAASNYTNQVVQQAVEKIEQARQASEKELRAGQAREFEKALRGAGQHLQEKLEGLGESFRQEFSQRIQADMAAATERLAETERRMRQMQEQIAASADSIPGLIGRARGELDALAEETKKNWSERLSNQVEKALARLGELREIAKGLNEKIEAAAESAHSGWRQKLEKELSEASAKLENATKASIQEAQERLTGELTAAAGNAAAKVTDELEQRAASARRLIEQTATEAEKRAAEVRVAMDEAIAQDKARAAEIEADIARIQAQSPKIEALAQKAKDEAVRQFQTMLAENQERLNLQADSVLADLALRMEPELEAHKVEMVSRVAAEVEKKVAAGLGRADALVKQLAELEVKAGQTLKGEQDRLLKDFKQASQGVLAKVMEELDAKSTEVTHTNFEQLYKSAEWYQRKAQTSMQAAFEKGITQASTQLREKAAELSTMFGSELDHYSRSYTEHMQAMLAEATKETSARLRTQMSESSDASVAKFSDELHRMAGDKLELIRTAGGTVTEETKERMRAEADSICRLLDTHAAQAAEEFRRTVTDRLRQNVAEARQEFQAQLMPVMETWRSEMKSNHEHWLRMLEQNSGVAVEQYKQRLENASNSWMVAAVSSLNQHSQGVLDSLAKAVEQRLRDTCADVLTGVAENMRERLLGISGDLRKGSGS